MILVADSGSTKTEWKVIKGNIAQESIYTGGINPYFLSENGIYQLLEKELAPHYRKSFRKVFFYGTGCNTEAKNNVVRNAIGRFLAADNIFIGSDLLGAARSLCQNDPGIACIMGTGSNSCYYDGNKIVSNVSPLGYILGDEGGGAVIGRKLLSAVLKKQISRSVIDVFFNTYRITPAEILERVYMKPFPNRFLGQFTMFISDNIEIPELQEIIRTSFHEFIVRNILQYPESKTLPVHFTGSIAFYFRSFLVELIVLNKLRLGTITLSPMTDLIKFHINNLNSSL
ncbi:MAG TPA: ATPase [Bacteroidales bacterium]|nr:ATPase [Bacteroidales bacterium]